MELTKQQEDDLLEEARNDHYDALEVKELTKEPEE